MTMATTNHWHLPPVKVREIPTGDVWFDTISYGSGSINIVSKAVEEDRKQPATERADVFYFDLSTYRLSGLFEDAVEQVIDWANCYHKFIPGDEVPATLVAIGTKLSVKGRRRFDEADVYYLDEGRRSIQRIMGAGPRSHQIYRLIQNLSGCSIGPNAFPYQMTASTPSPQSNPAMPTASNWEVYTQRPQHVDPAEIQVLFGLLTQKPKDWERDY